ncbi:acyltransferase family protein [Gordonia desulfuricans]|uniref:acyltransferase family protein n=1 Tax=Gordonia desulfuricans TaxID=89051 RepID=UPI00192EF416
MTAEQTASPATADTVEEQTPEYRRFFPQLEGMRAVAAIGVLTTHVAFQTGAVGIPVLGPVLGRLDLAVAVFFALSGFLLWRNWVAAAHRQARRPAVRRYLRHRVVRIWPAYVVVVVAVLTLLPEARGADLTVWLANLTLTQVYVPLSLTAGLTQMWSLSVEISFYLLLPFLGIGLFRLRGTRVGLRVPVLLGLGVISLGWAWVGRALPLPDGTEPTNWVFGHLPWFIAGLLLAEVSGAAELGGSTRLTRMLERAGARRGAMGLLFVVAYAAACTPIAGPTGLGDLAPWQFAIKMVLGALCGFALLAPLVCDAPSGHRSTAARRRFRVLTSPWMLALGRWSYGIFIWHVAVLAVVFGLFGIIPFAGDTLLVWCLTLALSIGVSAASYAFIEEPARDRLRRRESARIRSRQAVAGPSDAVASTTGASSAETITDDTATRAGN